MRAQATFDLGMANLEPSAYRLSFLAEGFEKEGGRSVTAGTEVLVSPRAWLVGVKPDGDFSYVHLGSQRVGAISRGRFAAQAGCASSISS